ncbi:hypothetical protein [Variovorax guangxiensis]|uniref:hypothetical protein n=1 Tax=Variovorax guangxiensis TaxID=1775474 RepID=UPI00285D323D|nr:hypothetical protein [Variovorax guangxiensis]MDR6856488.1 hypothetical protein [Variovorax guangxiensis]
MLSTLSWLGLRAAAIDSTLKYAVWLPSADVLADAVTRQVQKDFVADRPAYAAAR